MFAWFVATSLSGAQALAGVNIEYRVIVCPAADCQEIVSSDPQVLNIDGKEAEANTDFVSADTRNLWHPEFETYPGGNAHAQIYFTPDTPTKFRVSFDYTASSGLTGTYGGWATVSAGQTPPSAPSLSQNAPEFDTVSGSWSEIVDVRLGHRFYINAGAVAADGEDIHHDATIYNISVIPLPAGDLNFDMDVDGSDLANFIVAYIGETPEADLNLNGILNEDDLILFAENFGSND
jgi:hypothetical protein